MIGKVTRENHYLADVWVNSLTENLRRSECLCLNCGKLKPGQDDSCNIAKALYTISVDRNLAMIITRCPGYQNYKADESTTNEC